MKNKKWVKIFIYFVLGALLLSLFAPLIASYSSPV
ncbi:stressosome-associated protein Prli42 [Candidatus Peregrinibacteria bacterium]|nr:stressosome-associated protein Prli42 [Candidatus Peregrinibacteria bacterium]